jgi:hypothetical protein
MTTNNFHGYALDYKSGCADKNGSNHQTAIVQGSRSRKENQELIKRFFICHSGKEDTHGPVRNGVSLRQSLIMSSYN